MGRDRLVELDPASVVLLEAVTGSVLVRHPVFRATYIDRS